MWTGTILGIDLSLTCTGLCKMTVTQPDTPTVVSTNMGTSVTHQVARVTSIGHKDDTERQRQQRVSHIRRRVIAAAESADLVVIEGLFYNRQTTQGALIDRSWLWGSTLDQLTARRIPWVIVHPRKRAKFATDNGNASKTQVATAMTRMWPDTEAHDDNEFDALTMATMGLVSKLRRATPVRLQEHHYQVVAGITWPDDPETVQM